MRDVIADKIGTRTTYRVIAASLLDEGTGTHSSEGLTPAAVLVPIVDRPDGGVLHTAAQARPLIFPVLFGHKDPLVFNR